ncbi:MAG: class I SAM-dependent methyltransferase [Bacteroidota bacterium]
MKRKILRSIWSLLKLLIAIGAPFTFLSALWLKLVRKVGIGKISDSIFMRLGILPVADHYYEPMINPKKHLTKPLRDDRPIKGIDFNVKEQLELLAQFKYNEELVQFPIKKTKNIEYHYDNVSYSSGDSEYLYNIIRHFKPGKIIEIGSGHSTLMARNAITKNKSEDAAYHCHHICIEPYEQPFLETTGVDVMREKVENVDKSLFQNLERNDILFIDSSHIIRPQGDVLFEYLEVLPILKPGVIIHVHDIFTPKDYLDGWIYEHILWNEQYLLEAFLMFNSDFKIVGALNYLAHNHRKEFAEKCPVFAKQEAKEPGALWMVRK